MSNRDKIILSALLTGIIFLGFAIWEYVVEGKPIRPEMLYWLPVVMPVMGLILWLRWDWAPEKRREVRGKRKAEKDAETFE